MKLVIATPLYPPEPGGPATYTKLLEEELPKNGVDVEVVKFSLVRHLPKLIRHIAYYRRVVAAAKDADAILALDPVSVGVPAMHAARRAKKPFYVKVVGDYAWEQGRQRAGVTATLDEFVRTRQPSSFVRFLQRQQTKVASAATRVIVPSEYLKKVVVAWGIPEEKISVIYNAVSIEDIGSVPEAVAGLVHPTVVTVGRLVPWKGIPGLIDAVVAARASVPTLSLVIVGDGPARAELETYAKARLVNGYTFTGQLSHEDTLAVMQAADIFALNTAYEGFSHVLLEASMLGMPILTTPSGGNVELLENETTGLLVPVDSVEAMAQALTRLAGEPELRERLGRAAKSRAETLFGSGTLREKLTTLLT